METSIASEGFEKQVGIFVAPAVFGMGLEEFVTCFGMTDAAQDSENAVAEITQDMAVVTPSGKRGEFFENGKETGGGWCI